MLKCDEKSISSNGPVINMQMQQKELAFVVKNRLLFAIVLQPLVHFFLLLLRIEPAGTRTDSALLSNSQSKVPAFVVWFSYNRGGRQAASRRHAS